MVLVFNFLLGLFVVGFDFFLALFLFLSRRLRTGQDSAGFHNMKGTRGAN
jgi:hypothetical protein